MSKVDLIDNSWVDLVFEGKNQSYGAYKLRKQTGARNVKALVTVITVIALIFVIAIAKVAIENALPKASVNTADVELSKIEQKKETKVERKEQVKVEQQQVVEKVKSSVKFTAPVIKEEVEPEEEMKSQEELAQNNTAIGVFDVQGNDDAEGEVLKANQQTVEEAKVEDTKVFTVVEQMPSFPGGDAALMAYLSKNIQYPPIAEENGIQGRVVATFVVERDGSITDVQVMRGVDPSLDREAIRVLKGMPRWIPGKQNGSAVRVKYTVPVTFRLQ